MNLKPESLEFLLQRDVIDGLLPSIGKEQWLVLYARQEGHAFRSTTWCALLDDQAAARAAKYDSWDLAIGHGRPGFSRDWRDGEDFIAYERFGGYRGIRPLLLHRSFSGAFPKYVEMDEEFRLYHDLAEDRTRGVLLDFDSSGREIVVVRLTSSEAQAQLKYLRQFQAGLRLHLAIYIDSVRYSGIEMTDVAAQDHQVLEAGPGFRWRRDVASCDFKSGYSTFSRLLGKVILSPPPQDKAGIWPFKEADDKKQVAFVVDVDEEGSEVECTSDPDELFSNHCSTRAHYLTPVFFRREVLAKYFAEPERYEVSDGRLTCLGLWGCQIDNDLESHVVVFLGDLGRDLPYHERLHWRQFNVPPEGSISEVNFRRSILGQFADPRSADLAFRFEYDEMANRWERSIGWPLFLTLTQADSHILNTIRIPVTNSQVEFDQQIGFLAKLLVDSLNERELSLRAGTLEEGSRSIAKLEAFFRSTGFPGREKTIEFFRNLQTLRSTGSAHRKGSAYEKITKKLGIDPSNKVDAVRRLLAEAADSLRAIRLHYCGGP